MQPEQRSFDGGVTWTTTPNEAPWTDIDGVTADGTTTCEWMVDANTACDFSGGECPVCTDYAAGAFEQARNVSQLVGSQETILDPRYTPTTSSITAASVPEGFVAPDYADDLRDPSKFFIVYETGDNTTVEFGEAEPLDLFYARAINWGDDYELADADEDGITDVEPDLNDLFETFDWLEGSSLAMSGEAAVTASPGGQFFYPIWNQEDLDKHENVIGSDAWFRRVMELDSDQGWDDGITTPSGGAAGGGDDGGGGKPPKPPKPPKP